MDSITALSQSFQAHTLSDETAPQSLPVQHDDSSAEHKDVSQQVAEFRFLIDNSAVGGLIGKGGANVKRVREQSGAFVSIVKSESRAIPERIMTIKGTTQQIATATRLIIELLIEAASSKERAAGATTASDQAAVRLLVHKMAVGAVIGKAGAVIKETQQETGARVQVSNEPLSNSSEKTVTVTGTPAAVHDAVTRIVNQLKESPLKPGTRVYEYNPNAPYGQQPQHYSQHQYPPASHHGSPLPLPLSSSPAAPGGVPATPSTQKIAIPTVCAGCVIGKSGSVIRDLRAQSGTNISISDPEPGAPNERVVTLTGSAQGIQTAVYLIRQLVEQYQPQSASQQITNYS